MPFCQVCCEDMFLKQINLPPNKNRSFLCSGSRTTRVWVSLFNLGLGGEGLGIPQENLRKMSHTAYPPSKSMRRRCTDPSNFHHTVSSVGTREIHPRKTTMWRSPEKGTPFCSLFFAGYPFWGGVKGKPTDAPIWRSLGEEP